MKINTKKTLLCICCGVLAAVMIECGHIGRFSLLWPLLGLLMLIPVSEECNLAAGLITYIAASAVILLLPVTEGAFVFVLIGYYPIVRLRIHRLNIRTLRVGIRILIIVTTATIMFGIIRVMYGSELSTMIGASDAIILIVFIASSAIFFILYEFIIDRVTKLYQEHLHEKLSSLISE